MKIVERILHNYPETRNSDKLLMIKVWEAQMGRNMSAELKEFLLNDAINPESIARNRRKLQEQGLYPASKETEEFRFQNFIDAKYSAGRSVFN